VLGHPVVLIRLGEAVHAVDGYCPHRGMPLGDATIEGDVIQCLWHGFEYDVRTGQALWPDDRGEPVPTYDTRVREGAVELRVRLGER
jgi:nitrite reductase/ring-hydroxylating ferredoxin subunit